MKTIVFYCLIALIYAVNSAPTEFVGNEINIRSNDVQIQKSILVYETSTSGDVSNIINYIILTLSRDVPRPAITASAPPIIPQSFNSDTIKAILGAG